MSDFLLSILAPWFVLSTFFLLFILLASYTFPLVRYIFSIQKKQLLWSVSVLLLTSLVRFALVPNTHRIYFDEDRYLNHAVTFARFGITKSIVLATPKKLIRGDMDTAVRVTVPVFNAIILKVSNYSYDSLFIWAKIISIVQVVLLFAFVVLFFNSISVALIASTIFAFLPIPVFWSTSIGLDSFFVFFSLLSLTASSLYARKPTIKNALILVSATMLVLFVRLEAFLMLPILLGCIYVIRKEQKKRVIVPFDKVLLAIVIPLLLFRGLMSVSVLGSTWCCGESTPLEAFQLTYIFRNTLPNLLSFFVRPEVPIVISILAIGSLFGSKDRRISVLGLWLFLYFSIYSFYFAGLFFTLEYSGSYGRYALMLFPPVSILAALSIDQIFRYLQTRPRSRFTSGIAIIILLLALEPTVKRYPYFISTSPYEQYVDAGPRKMNLFLTRVAREYTEPNAVLIHALTDISLLYGKTAVYFGAVISEVPVKDFVVQKVKEGVPVYMFQTHTCTVNPEKCTLLTDEVIFEPVPLPESETSKLELVRVVLP